MSHKSSIPEGNHTHNAQSASGGVLGVIFPNGELLRIERMARIARCKAIASQLHAGEMDHESNLNLIELRRLLRDEYGAAIAAFVQGNDVPIKQQPAPAVRDSDGVVKGLVMAVKGAFPWTP